MEVLTDHCQASAAPFMMQSTAEPGVDIDIAYAPPSTANDDAQTLLNDSLQDSTSPEPTVEAIDVSCESVMQMEALPEGVTQIGSETVNDVKTDVAAPVPSSTNSTQDQQHDVGTMYQNFSESSTVHGSMPAEDPVSANGTTSLNHIDTPAAPQVPEQQTPALGDTTNDTEIPIAYDYDNVEGHRVLRLRPTSEQWDDFPAVLAFARSLGADGDGCFKVIIPTGLHDTLPEKPAETVPAHAYKVKLIRRTTFWQLSTVPSVGEFSSSQTGPEFSDSVGAAIKNLKHLFRKSQNRQMRNIRYRADVPAWTKTQRQLAGVPEKSPIYPLKGDKLDQTKAIIPGIHTPYVYESAPFFGATFQIHAEDFRLASLNHLYKGRKIWIVVPATDVDIAEKALGRGAGCSQFMRHRAEFFFPDKLEKLGIPYRLVDQRPGETIVVLPDAYHEGFSTGYTLAEAKNYADTRWSTDSYQPCRAECKLATAIPAAFMQPVQEGEERLDLCAPYSGGSKVGLPQILLKREHDETITPSKAMTEGPPLENRPIKRIKIKIRVNTPPVRNDDAPKAENSVGVC